MRSPGGRTHGWGGHPPADDDEAVQRILTACRECLGTKGEQTSISDVAGLLGVTRQTVYRYFASTEDLLLATAIQAAVPYLDRMTRHLRGVTDPAEAAVEAVAYTLEAVPHDPALGVLFRTSRVSAAEGVTSEVAMTFGRAVIERFDVDWPAAGFTGPLLDELVEQLLRTLQSHFFDTAGQSRPHAELRAYLTRWIAPAIRAIHEGAVHDPAIHHTRGPSS